MWKYGLILLVCCLVYYYIYLRLLYASNQIIKGNSHLTADKLMIVAHPDDECIFGGSLLIEQKGWHVICVTGGSYYSRNKWALSSENNRIIEFVKVMNCLECKYEMWDFEDNLFNANWDVTLQYRLKQLLNQTYQKVITHNLEGEYGHIQHKKLSQIVHQLRPTNLYVFHFTPVPRCALITYLPQLKKALLHYKSQQNIVQKYAAYILHQNIKQVNTY